MIVSLFPVNAIWVNSYLVGVITVLGNFIWNIVNDDNAILNAKGDSLRRRWEGNFAGASAPLVLNVLLDHLQRCSAARARKVRA